jgi:hypothetical protein
MTLKPLVFVAMPIGVKLKNKRTKIDFDDIYNKAIKPLSRNLKLDIIRADEEKYGGIIHAPMFERLLLAEIVIADLTLANPNVFYELGIRHCARPKSTILIVAKGMKLPFDVSPLRAIFYDLKNGKISKSEASNLSFKISERLKSAFSEQTGPDSPLFQLIEKFPGINLPHEVTESFRDRIKFIDSVRLELESARHMQDFKKGKSKIKKLERKIGDLSLAPSELLIDLILSYRDINAWNDMIRVISNFPDKVKKIITVQEQLAFALNRRNENNDRSEAIRILKRLLLKHGNSPETCGILGRVYKDIYFDAKSTGKSSEANAALDESIKYYTLGFEEDPRDYYPGINALTLLLEKNDETSHKEMKKLNPLVAFAISRRGGLNSTDYWDIAAILELAIIGKDWKVAKKAADKLIFVGNIFWNFETTYRNLNIIRAKLQLKKVELNEFDMILRNIKRKLNSLKKKY